MPTKAQLIDAYFRSKNYYPHVPYTPLGETLVDVALNHTGPDNLWVSTAATVVEMEGGGKNVFGCDAGSWFCNERVTADKVDRLIAGYKASKIWMNGVGTTQITYYPYVQKAQLLGGAHIIRNQMIVGFNVLNDLLNQYGYYTALEAYNSGNPSWNDPNNPYDQKFAALHNEWKKRLASATDGEEEKPVPAKPPASKDVVLKKGLGKDGNPNGTYERSHPTLYTWRPDVSKRVHSLVNMPKFKGKVWANTYRNHPPGWNRDTTSADFWGWGGRGSKLPDELHKAVFEELFNDPNKPDIWWIITRGKMWTRAGGWQDAPTGPAGSDAGHWNHLHVTYVDA